MLPNLVICDVGWRPRIVAVVLSFYIDIITREHQSIMSERLDGTFEGDIGSSFEQNVVDEVGVSGCVQLQTLMPASIDSSSLEPSVEIAFSYAEHEEAVWIANELG